MTFNQWMIEVDKLLISKIGLTHLDIDDWLYADAYNDGLDPVDVLEDIIESADPLGMLDGLMY